MIARINRPKTVWGITAAGIVLVVGVGAAKWAGAADLPTGGSRTPADCIEVGSAPGGSNETNAEKLKAEKGKHYRLSIGTLYTGAICTTGNGPDLNIPAHAPESSESKK